MDDRSRGNTQYRGTCHNCDQQESWPAKMNPSHTHPKLPVHNPSLKNTLATSPPFIFNSLLSAYRPVAGNS
jgi:hypothetical protein